MVAAASAESGEISLQGDDLTFCKSALTSSDTYVCEIRLDPSIYKIDHVEGEPQSVRIDPKSAALLFLVVGKDELKSYITSIDAAQGGGSKAWKSLTVAELKEAVAKERDLAAKVGEVEQQFATALRKLKDSKDDKIPSFSTPHEQTELLLRFTEAGSSSPKTRDLRIVRVDPESPESDYQEINSPGVKDRRTPPIRPVEKGEQSNGDSK